MQLILPSTSVYISKISDCEGFVLWWSQGGEDNVIKNDYALTQNAELVNFLDAAELWFSLQIPNPCNSSEFLQVIPGGQGSGGLWPCCFLTLFCGIQPIPASASCPSRNTRTSLICSTEELLCHPATPYSSFQKKEQVKKLSLGVDRRKQQQVRTWIEQTAAVWPFTSTSGCWNEGCYVAT